MDRHARQQVSSNSTILAYAFNMASPFHKGADTSVAQGQRLKWHFGRGRTAETCTDMIKTQSIAVSVKLEAARIVKSCRAVCSA